jgi:hypothetical protein
MDDTSQVKMKAVQLITDYMGNGTGKLYANFYQGKDDNIILASLKELLAEYLGDSQAEAILISKGLEVSTK